MTEQAALDTTDWLSNCPCGREARYTLIRDDKMVGSCNKYRLCPTYAELEQQSVEWRSRAMNAERDLRILRKILVPSEETKR